MKARCHRDKRLVPSVGICVWLLTGFAGAAPPGARHGEFNGDLQALRAFYTAPLTAGQGNHLFDLFGGARLRQELHSHGLTNNRALLVLSHGKGIHWNGLLRYAFYPDPRAWSAPGAARRPKHTPYFSAADLAAVLGSQAAEEIHNVLVAGCNQEGTFDPAELRRLFPNATNIVHAPGGHDGHELVFRHTLLYSSADVRLLYSAPGELKIGRLEPSARARRAGFVPYIAHLYRPGALASYRMQIAGRELLEPSVHPAVAAPERRLAEAAAQIVSAARGRRPTTATGGFIALTKPPETPPSTSETELIRWRSGLEAPSTANVIRWER